MVLWGEEGEGSGVVVEKWRLEFGRRLWGAKGAGRVPFIGAGGEQEAAAWLVRISTAGSCLAAKERGGREGNARSARPVLLGVVGCLAMGKALGEDRGGEERGGGMAARSRWFAGRRRARGGASPAGEE